MEFLAYRGLVGLLQRLPEGLSLRLGEGVGWMIGVVLRIRWGTVLEHLSFAFPEKDARWRRKVARASFRHLGRESVATFRMGGKDAAWIRDRTEMVGFEAMDEALQEGRGLVVVTGHLGNWEMGGASIAAWGVSLDVIAQRQRNPLFDVDITRNRESLGMTVVERRDAPKRMLRTLRAGRGVGIVGDQNVRRGGVFVDFFGRPASTARGPAMFALRTGAPLFAGAVRRLPGFPQRYRAEVQRIQVTPSEDLEADVVRLTEAHTRYLEDKVREAPEQYFWQHRRWKTQPQPQTDLEPAS
jgi:KDO2-lipid IV(A) lauroyltransferase